MKQMLERRCFIFFLNIAAPLERYPITGTQIRCKGSANPPPPPPLPRPPSLTLTFTHTGSFLWSGWSLMEGGQPELSTPINPATHHGLV